MSDVEGLLEAWPRSPIRKEFAGFSKVRTFELADVRNLRPICTNHDHHQHRAPDAAGSGYVAQSRAASQFVGSAIADHPRTKMSEFRAAPSV